MNSVLPMTLKRAQELITPLYDDTAEDISPAWQQRLIEALEYVIENETKIIQVKDKS